MRGDKGPAGTIFVVFALVSALGIAGAVLVNRLITENIGSIPGEHRLDEVFGQVPGLADTDAILVTTTPRLEIALAVGAVLVLVIFLQVLRQGLDRALARRDDGEVRYRPPEGVRPAHLGLLLDGEVHQSDLVASIIDLAARGHLRIVAIEAGSRYVLVRQEGSDPLHQFERVLLDRLFMTAGAQWVGEGDQRRPAVELSSLRGRFASGFEDVRDVLLHEAVARGWFRRHPDDVRWYWWALGFTGLVGAIVAGVILAVVSDWAIVAIPVASASVVLLLVSRWLPTRTRAGRRMLRESAGFRRFVETAEAGRAEFAEESDQMIDYLGYAVAMGLVSGWVGRFRGLEDTGRRRRIDPTPLDAYLEVARLS
ncbi:MAG: DUF2207 domain-containing protein [Actinobacteria bacterium]|nr:DUF2207 domain-containing protein [Actinomycetota bacterium]